MEEPVGGQRLTAGELQHNVAVEMPWEQVVEAHEMVENGQAMGNVVVRTDR